MGTAAAKPWTPIPKAVLALRKRRPLAFNALIYLIEETNFDHGTGNGMGLSRFQGFFSSRKLAKEWKTSPATAYRILSKDVPALGGFVSSDKRPDISGRMRQGYFVDLRGIFPESLSKNETPQLGRDAGETFDFIPDFETPPNGHRETPSIGNLAAKIYARAQENETPQAQFETPQFASLPAKTPLSKPEDENYLIHTDKEVAKEVSNHILKGWEPEWKFF